MAGLQSKFLSVTRSKSKVKVAKSKFMVSKKGHVMRYLYMKYQSPNPNSLKVGQKVKVKVTRSKIIILNQRSGHEASMYEIPKP